MNPKIRRIFFQVVLIFFSECRGQNQTERMGFSKLLVVAGYNGDDLDHVEVVDLADEGSVCRDPESYPHKVFGISGALLNGHLPMVCGGYHCCGGNYKNECYILTENGWIATSPMKEKRLWSSATTASVTSGNTPQTNVWMTGGTHQDINAMDSTEIFVPSGTDGTGSWQAGPNLPVALEEHCLVRLATENKFLVIGGQQPFMTRVNSTLFFDFESQTWTQGPGLRTARDGLGCSLFTDSSTGKSYVVAAGGFDGYHHLSSVEILDLENPEVWQAGPELPFSLHNGRLIQDSNGAAIFVGGQRGEDYKFSKQLYRLETIESGWKEMMQQLKIERNNHVAFLVPDELVNC